MRTATKRRPRTKPPEERRDELMNAALRLFLKHGVAPTTIEQITSGADVAKGTFYLYFSSKEDVLAALGQRFAQELLAGIKAAIAAKPNQDWKGKLATWARAGVAGYLDSIRLHDVFFPDPIAFPRGKAWSTTSSSIIFRAASGWRRRRGMVDRRPSFDGGLPV
jgi:AcrR family transcriptional regulator